MLQKKIRAGMVPITIPNQLHLMLRRWQLFGPLEAIRYYGNRAFGPGQRNHRTVASASNRQSKAEAAKIDHHFGLERAVPAPEAEHSDSAKLGILYERSSETIVREIMQRLPIDFEKYTFVDLGAGKGFVLCLATEFSFKKIVGVEYSKKLAAVAAENLSHYGLETRKCHDTSCILGDAGKFVFPPEPTVVYLYNPFQGHVMDRVLANVKQSLNEHPRDLWIVYANPWEHRKFKRSREFEVIALTWDYAIYRRKSDRLAAA